MQVRRTLFAMALAASAILLAAACNVILGIEDTRVQTDGGSDLVCDLPTTACTDRCIDLSSDAANCGACGHDCGDGTCSAGVCQPVTIASAIEAPYAMAVTPSGEQVFWLTATEVRRCPFGGCGASVRIGDFNTLVPIQKRDRIAATNNEIFWLGKTASDVLMSCPTAGCVMGLPAVKTGHDLDTPRAVTLAGPTLVVAQRFEGRLCQQTGGCANVPCVSADSIQSATVDDTNIYWLETTDPAGLYSCPRAGGSLPLRLTAESGLVVRLLGDTLYVLRQGGASIYSCGRNGCSGAGTPLVTGQAAGSMAVDESGIYWTAAGSATSATGEVLTCPLTGCPTSGPRVLASGQAQPTDVTLHGPDVLWVNQGLMGVAASGSIMRVRK